jgi:hypothetical protein
MARIDDYVAAKKMAAKALETVSAHDLGQTGGFEVSGEALVVPFLDRTYRVTLPGFDFVDGTDPGREVPLQEQVLILHYLQGASGPWPRGQWIAYREIPGAGFYFSAFVKRAIDPLKKSFGQNAPALIRVAGLLGGRGIQPGDAAFEFQVLPRVPIRVILWQGDEEFAPEANILFDETVGDLLSPEDVAWLSGMLVYRLMSLKNIE